MRARVLVIASLLALAALVLALGAASGGPAQPARAPAFSSSTSATASAITLAVGSTTVAIATTSETSVLAVMRAAEARGQFSFTGRSYPSLGFFVESIDGRAAAGGSSWALYINGVYAQNGAAQARVAPGDAIEWRYEK
jgi:hypothetical protein